MPTAMKVRAKKLSEMSRRVFTCLIIYDQCPEFFATGSATPVIQAPYLLSNGGG